MKVLLDSFPGSLWKVMERYTGAITSQNCRTSQEFWAAVFQGMQFYTSLLVNTVPQCGTSSILYWEPLCSTNKRFLWFNFYNWNLCLQCTRTRIKNAIPIKLHKQINIYVRCYVLHKWSEKICTDLALYFRAKSVSDGDVGKRFDFYVIFICSIIMMRK